MSPTSGSPVAEWVHDMAPAKRPGTVLVVEDEPLIRMTIEECLADQGFTVDAVGTSVEAVARVRGNPDTYRAAILDIGLPDGRGDQLADALRDIVAGLPIVLCTGYGMGEIRSRAFQQGRIVMISKPFLSEALLEALRAVEDQPDVLGGHDHE
ncbi:Sensor histidine kinase RcsC [Alphaproteobacteria bacterium SO-S41]|nr:Sensor histidine kinase RcsC [Alphaproteobacteria bacterium SO-S41]